MKNGAADLNWSSRGKAIVDAVIGVKAAVAHKWSDTVRHRSKHVDVLRINHSCKRAIKPTVWGRKITTY